MGHNLVHQVLTNGLGSLVQKIALVLTNLLEFSRITFFTLFTILLGIFFKELLLGSITLRTLSLNLLTFDHGLNFVNLTLRVLVLLGLFGGKHLLLFLFGQVLVIHDVKLSLRALLISRCVGTLFSFTLFLASLLLNIFQEAVVSVGDQVQAAWLAVLLELGAHELQSLILIHSLFRVIKSHAVFLADKLAKEVVNVAFRLKILIKLTVNT